MAINPTDAIQAYNAAARSAGVRGVGPADPSAGAAGGFQSVLQSQMAQPAVGTQVAPSTLGGLVRGAVQQTIEATKQSEKMSMAAIAGTADMQDVVMAVTNAEMTLQTIVAVRDKVINAYNEIIKMPI